jgi:hypothetical protein
MVLVHLEELESDTFQQEGVRQVSERILARFLERYS